MSDPQDRQEADLTRSVGDPFEDKADDVSQTPEVLS